MSKLWLGTLVGAAIGGWLVAWPGAVLGGLLGHLWDRQGGLVPQREPCERCARARFLGHLTATLPRTDWESLWDAWVVYQNVPSERLRQAFQRGRTRGALAEYPRTVDQAEWVEHTLRDGWEWLLVLEPHAGPMRREWQRWGHRWGWNDEQLAAFKLSKNAMPFIHYMQALERLQLDEHDSDAQVRQRYRELMSQHHPDKLLHQGNADSVAQAQQQCMDIQAAYRCVQQYRKQQGQHRRQRSIARERKPLAE